MNEEFNLICEELSKIGKEFHCESHHELVHFGDKVDKMYLVKKGGLVLNHVHPKTARERTVNFFIPDFHPIATVSHAYVLQEPSNYYLKTFTNSVLVEVSRMQISSFLDTTEFAELFQSFGMKSMIEKNEMRANLLSLTSLEMLVYLHEKYPQILLQVPSKYIADYLGITPQWLSKLKHSL